MATVFVRKFLSSATHGGNIGITATAATGDLIHTAVAGTGDIDMVWLWAINTATQARQITLEFGGTAAGDQIIFTVTAEDGVFELVPGWPLRNAKVVRAFTTSTVAGLKVNGYVNLVDF